VVNPILLKKLNFLMYGWLAVVTDALSGTRRVFERAFATVDPRAVYDPLVNLPASGLAPPRNAYDAYAYDAVWATALGAAAWLKSNRSSLVDSIRAARFRGASGTVNFDNVTGDRAAAGVLIRIYNAQLNVSGPVDETMPVALVPVIVGEWEQERGDNLVRMHVRNNRRTFGGFVHAWSTGWVWL
jgi:hypothetical protein